MLWSIWKDEFLWIRSYLYVNFYVFLCVNLHMVYLVILRFLNLMEFLLRAWSLGEEMLFINQ